jgi:hypothetical protein
MVALSPLAENALRQRGIPREVIMAAKRPDFAQLYDRGMAEESAQPLSEQLEEIRAQLAWVRDYL